MIEQSLLYKMGYRIKTRELHDGSSDFVHPDKKRRYLANYKDGEVNIVFPTIDKRQIITFSDSGEFEDWHNEYE